ncbi:WxcM-like, C-terminal [Candidatus Nanopelagicaceae bacterium]
MLDAPDLPFNPRRLYWIHSVPKDESRGNHAHKELNQFFVALKGEVSIEISSNKQKEVVTLDCDSKILVLKSGYWRKLFNFSPDAVILVGADSEYNSNDYIHDWDEFSAWREENFD